MEAVSDSGTADVDNNPFNDNPFTEDPLNEARADSSTPRSDRQDVNDFDSSADTVVAETPGGEPIPSNVATATTMVGSGVVLPAVVESVDIEPVQIQPAVIEPVDIVPIDVAPVEIEPVDVAAAAAEPAELESVDIDPEVFEPETISIEAPAQENGSPAFGIADAIDLMRSLPRDPNIDLVVRVVRVTLGAVNVSIEDIMQDASRKEKALQDTIAALHAEEDELEKQLYAKRCEIAAHDADLKETVTVRERLHLADKYTGHGPPPTPPDAARNGHPRPSESIAH